MRTGYAWFLLFFVASLGQGSEYGYQPIRHGGGTKAAQVEDIVETTRKLLKTLRTWKQEHAAEVALAKCVAVHLTGISSPNWGDLLDSRERGPRSTSVGGHLICGGKVFRAIWGVLSKGSRFLAVQCFGRYFLRKFIEWIDAAP